MTAHIRLVSSEAGEGAEPRAPEENAADCADAPIGLPEEGGSMREAILGEAPPPLAIESDDRTRRRGKTSGCRTTGVGKLIAFVWPPKRKAVSRVAGVGGEGERKGDEALAVSPAAIHDGGPIELAEESGPGSLVADRQTPVASAASVEGAGERKDEWPVGDAAPLQSVAGEAANAAAEGEPGASRDGSALAGARRSRYRGKVAIAAALAAGVALAAIVVLNWPHEAPPAPVETGMVANAQAKLMAPAAALASVPPREEPNVSHERPLIVETRGDEFAEMLSLKAGANPGTASPAPAAAKADSAAAPSAAAPASTPVGAIAGLKKAEDGAAVEGVAKPAPGAPVALLQPVAAAQPVAPAHPGSEEGLLAAATSEAKAPAAQAGEAGLVDGVSEPGSRAPVSSLAPRPVAPAPAPQEQGLGEAGKIEARLDILETELKDRSSETRARIVAEKAETHTLEKIAELGALVKRLAGQVKDLQDKVDTLSTGADEKFADLTRRVALSEANRAVASAENASPGGVASAPEKEGAGSSNGGERTRVKAVADDVRRNYRIQAASPGLAMLTIIDGSPDEKPVEVAIGTELPFYGKVRSIEQHGETWVVKADRGSIE
jgi:hypothetical protein